MPDRLPDRHFLSLLAIFALSVVVKLVAAQNMVWEIDYVPVIARGQAFFDGGGFPVVGTLSSVAAYNMPFLVWLHMPALLLTRDVPAIFLITLLTFNFIATLFVYRFGVEFFNARVGLLAAALFTFSETAISGSYTGWAQLLLPGFYIIVLYSLYRWRIHGHGGYAALAIITTTAATMTHFSAVLLFGVIVAFAIITRPALRLNAIGVGLVAAAILLAPYLAFEAGRDFVDVRAFLTQTITVPSDVLDPYRPENQPPVATPPDEPSASPKLPGQQSDEPAPSVIERILSRLSAVPGQVWDGLLLVFTFVPTAGLHIVLADLFLLGIGIALYETAQHIRRGWRVHTGSGRLWRVRPAADALVETTPGRITLLFICILLVLAGLIVTGSPAAEQSTYYYGLFSLQFVIVAYAVDALLNLKFVSQQARGWLTTVVLIIIIGIPAAARISRENDRLANDDRYSAYNVGLYRHVNSAVAWIAADWGGGESLTVSYDILRETPQQWWVAAWHTVDSGYRMGMAYDYLLHSYYGLENANQSPDGLADDADYIVVYRPGLRRYDEDAYDAQQFGAIYVLKPIEDSQ